MRSGVKGNKGNTNSYSGSTNANFRHGMRGTRFWTIWSHMKTRCLNKNAQFYKDYGGRGIKVCEKWLKFGGFHEDMYPTYQEGLTIDRKNNDGDYTKENCHWVTQKQQMSNTRKTIFIELDGKRIRLKEAAEMRGVKYITAYDRIFRQKKIPEEALIGSLLGV